MKVKYRDNGKEKYGKLIEFIGLSDCVVGVILTPDGKLIQKNIDYIAVVEDKIDLDKRMKMR